jgi:hypothetical protein
MGRLLATSALALTAAALSACGGGGGIPITSFPTPTVTTQALTKTDYITKGDAICAEANAALGNLAAADAATLASQKVDITQNVVDQLTSLGTPTEDAAILQEFLDAETEILDNLQKIQLAVERGDTAGTGTFDAAITAAEARASAAATSYGFQECGTASSGGGVVTPPSSGAPSTGTPAPTPAPTPTPPTGGAGAGGGTGGGGAGSGGGSGGVGPG